MAVCLNFISVSYSLITTYDTIKNLFEIQYFGITQLLQAVPKSHERVYTRICMCWQRNCALRIGLWAPLFFFKTFDMQKAAFFSDECCSLLT